MVLLMVKETLNVKIVQNNYSKNDVSNKNSSP